MPVAVFSREFLRGRSVRRRGLAYLAARGAAMVVCVLEPMRAWADDGLAHQVPTQEISGGVDAKTGGWAAYAGTTMAIGGSLYENGWRLRFTGGYGNYWFGKEIGASFRGANTFGEILAGYQVTSGPLTAKLFAGAAGGVGGGNGWDQLDDFRTWQSADWTPKGAIETWLNIGERGFGQLDLAYETKDRAYGSRLRLGYRITPHISIGPEGALGGGPDFESVRAGAFIRYEAPFGEVSISGGAIGEPADLSGAYGTANLLFRF